MIGGSAGDALTEGSYNVAVGRHALSTEDDHGKNVAVGFQALYAQNAGADAYNIAVGYNAGGTISTGVDNTIIGGLAGDAVTTGSYNVAVGRSALGANTIASSNTSIGWNSLGDNVDGSKNVAIGHQSLRNFDPASAADTFNVALGYHSGLSVSTGTQNTIIGGAAGDALTTGASNIIIGYNAAASAVDVSNEVNIYNGSVTARFQGSASSWSFVSDARDKKDIEDLELGVEFINKLKPRKFKWDLRDSDVDKGKQASGFVAQEIQEVLDNESIDYSGIVDTNNPDQYTVAQASMIPMLVKAIQELSAEVKELKKQING